ncbi:hypothetical protein OO256_16130 [Pseudomonas sp. DCB_CB]|uniref:hypothetical protein n=1 Tax=unclassified Pseudomonas TaxID=196821 RepID=UPI002249782F|nr:MULTISPECIES: hypothetical protein [unclassified Pseudomonas]MCX2692283.1 hypothetical protein [Pseudomonas sp. DCB_BZ]MCX2857620.1 hypothetical protein [Pseudomonas sp. DCB_CB]
MITKKITKGQEDRLIRHIYAKYIDRFGRGVRSLGEFPVLITSAEVYLGDMPDLAESSGNLVRYRFVDLLKELEALGYMRFDGSTSFFLTEAGYKKAAMSRADRFLDFCNRNQGLAVPVAAASLIISIIALFVAT